jgi:hypothetical protein
MFWEKSNKSAIDVANKFRFVAVFNNIQRNNTTPTNILYDELSKPMALAVKAIDLPKLQIDTERAYVGEYVHYFQNGPINWGDINIKLIDAYSLNQEKFSNPRKLLSDFIENLNSAYIGLGGVSTRDSTISFRQNRTNLIDSPTLCNNIQIYYLNDFLSDTIQSENLEASISPLSKGRESYFTIYNPKLIKIDFGALDYGSDDINEVNITITPEWCEYTQQDP